MHGLWRYATRPFLLTQNVRAKYLAGHLEWPTPTDQSESKTIIVYKLLTRRSPKPMIVTFDMIRPQWQYEIPGYPGLARESAKQIENHKSC